MDSIIIVCVILSWVISTVVKSKQQAQKKAAKTAFPIEAMTPEAATAKTVKAEQMSMPQVFTPAMPTQPERPAQPDIHPRVANRMRVTPETADMFSGSMNADSHEGEDPCHEAELHKVQAADRIPLTDMPSRITHPQEKSNLALDFSEQGLVNAFVMQEILARPCDRRHRVPMQTTSSH